jgi:transposase-like protein
MRDLDPFNSAKVRFIQQSQLKRIIGATLGFKSMKTAYATIKGIEVMRALRKGQASAFYYGDPRAKCAGKQSF